MVCIIYTQSLKFTWVGLGKVMFHFNFRGVRALYFKIKMCLRFPSRENIPLSKLLFIFNAVCPHPKYQPQNNRVIHGVMIMSHFDCQRIIFLSFQNTGTRVTAKCVGRCLISFCYCTFWTTGLKRTVLILGRLEGGVCHCKT